MDRELQLLEIAGLNVITSSAVRDQDLTLFLVQDDEGGKLLAVRGEPGDFEGVPDEQSGALLCPLTHANAQALRSRFPWLRAVPLGLKTSAGFGDRLGLATQGHIRSLRRVCDPETEIAPIFAQQSVRENARTGRTPQEVMDDAIWGVLEEGWRLPWGADADHLKTEADVEAFAVFGICRFVQSSKKSDGGGPKLKTKN